MISLSESAAAKIGEIFSSLENPPIGIQAGVKGGGCSGFSYYLDYIYAHRDDFKVFDSNGITVYMDHKSFLYLMGTEIDFEDGLSGAGFKFVNPNAKRTCGCGESFSI